MAHALVPIKYDMKVFRHFDLKSYAKYDQTDQGIQSHIMQHIISSELNGHHTLFIEEVFVQEHEARNKLHVFQFFLYFSTVVFYLIFWFHFFVTSL
ncbi:unnamed protein product [Sphagnum balticum]